MSNNNNSFKYLDLNHFLPHDDMASIEEYMKQKPTANEYIPMPDSLIGACAVKPAKEGETTRLLRTAPCILPPVDRLPASYMPEELKQPKYIPNGLGKGIPIFLDEDYFKFSSNEETEHMKLNVINKLNDLDRSERSRCSSSASISSASTNGSRNGKAIKNNSDNNNNNDSSGSSAEFNRRFSAVFGSGSQDDDSFNGMAKAKVSDRKKSVPQQNWRPDPQPNARSHQRYYNPRELYELKRGKNTSK